MVRYDDDVCEDSRGEVLMDDLMLTRKSEHTEHLGEKLV